MAPPFRIPTIALAIALMAEVRPAPLAARPDEVPPKPRHPETAAAKAEENWPQWRGPSRNGISNETNLPVKWSQTENVLWKLPMPALSGSTPIVWGDRIFLNVANALPDARAVDNGPGASLHLWCVDRAKGTILWQRDLGSGNRMQRKQNQSTPSPVTDGTTVWVMTGTGILKAFDFAGKELWTRDIQADYGRFGLNWGYGSSPLLHGDALFVQVLHGMRTDDPSYLLRIDTATGKTVWRVERPTHARVESPDSYTTPAALQYAGNTEIVLTGGDVVTGHDPATGKELWRADGLNPTNDANYRIVASPVTFDDLIIAPTRERPMLVLKAGGRGDVTKSHLLWTFDNGPDVPTPVTDGTHVYVINDRGIMFCLEARTGREIYGRQRLRPGTYSGSPVLADGRIYITNEDGVTSVVKAGPQFQLLSENEFDDYTLSSPAVSNGRIYFRTTKFLWAIGSQK
jgi:outer membrane protein assembly factor BamB